MARKRRVFGGKFRAKVALAAIRGDKTLSQLASQFNVSGNQVSAWKRKLLMQAAELFEDGRRGSAKDAVADEALYEQIGRLKMELEWLKKKGLRRNQWVGSGAIEWLTIRKEPLGNLNNKASMCF